MSIFATHFCLWQDPNNVRGRLESFFFSWSGLRTFLIRHLQIACDDSHGGLKADSLLSDGKPDLSLLLQFSAWNPQAVRVAHSSRVYITWGWGEARGGIQPNDSIRPRPRTAAISLSGNPGLQKPHRKSACSRADGISRFGWANTRCWGRNGPVPLTQQKGETDPSSGSKLMFVLRNQKKRSAGNTIGGCLDLSDTANRQKTNDRNQLEGPQLTSIIPFMWCLFMGEAALLGFGPF